MSTHNGIITIIFQRKGAISIVRNSFIQMSKLTNLKGRINYISSHARQENLYAVYETTDRKFWTELAKCNQEEFKKSGTEGKCIEARERNEKTTDRASITGAIEVADRKIYNHIDKQDHK